MPITFSCNCSQPLVVEDQYGGMAIQCPRCGDTPVAPASAAVAAPTRNAKPWKKGSDADEPAPLPVDPNNVFGFTPQAGDVARERNRLIQERENPPPEKQQSPDGGMNGSVAGGAIAMLVAIVWFVGGLMADLIFFYPPILFIIGLVSFCKGLAEGPKRG